MKKYISLAALLVAGAAFANAEEYKLSISPDQGDSFCADDYEFQFMIESLDEVKDGTVLALYWGTFSNANYCANGFKFNVSDLGKITLTVGCGSMANAWDGGKEVIKDDTTFTPDSAEDRSLTFSDVEILSDTLYTIKCTGEPGVQTVSIGAYFMDTFMPYATGTYNGNMNGGTKDTTMGTLFNQVYAPIPEPSAFGLLAGLGALALVGARRRRR